ncbi:MAG: ATP-binding protein [Cyclobacteriaceae bacterium]
MESDHLGSISFKSHQITSVNQPLLHMLGYEQENELLGQPLHHLFNGGEFSYLSRPPFGEEFTLRALCKDKSSLELKAVLLGTSDCELMLVRKMPITSAEQLDHKQLFNALFNSAFEQSLVGMALLDLGGNLLRTNQRLSEITSYSATELSNHYFNASIGQDKSAESRMIFNLLNPNREEKEKDLIKFTHRSGWQLQLILTVSTVLGQKDEPNFYLLTIQDITKIKSSEMEISRMSQEFDSFVYRASHDLQGPLSSIEGICHVLRITQPNPETEKYVDMISQVSGKMKKALLGMLEAARINELNRESRRIDFEELVAEVLKDLEKVYGSDKLNIRTSFAAELDFHSDPSYISIITKNLLENSIVFRDTRKDSFAALSVESTESGGICLTVSDNGVGIAPEDHEEVFEMFCRKNANSQGSGIGLYLVKQAVRRLNGSIKLRSNIGEGTSIQIIL